MSRSGSGQLSVALALSGNCRCRKTVTFHCPIGELSVGETSIGEKSAHRRPLVAESGSWFILVGKCFIIIVVQKWQNVFEREIQIKWNFQFNWKNFLIPFSISFKSIFWSYDITPTWHFTKPHIFTSNEVKRDKLPSEMTRTKLGEVRQAWPDP